MGIQFKESMKDLKSFKPAKVIQDIKDTYQIQEVIKLAANENTFGASPKVLAAIREIDDEFIRYPDGKVRILRNKLAELQGIPEEKYFFGNGSFEILSLLSKILIDEGDESIVSETSFGWYKSVTAIEGGKIVVVPQVNLRVNLPGMLEAITERTKVIWICNPNNPTGNYVTHDELKDFLSKVPNHIAVVIDEAYAEYATNEDFPRVNEFIQTYENIIVLRTFSKFYGLAGVRIGYAIANESVIDELFKVKMPHNVNALAQKAAVAALEDIEFQEKCLRNNIEGRNYYETSFRNRGLEFVPSSTNFVLVNINCSSKSVCEEMLKRGVYIRPGAEFGLENYVRISIGRKEENEKVVETLFEILDEQDK
ncbi:Histidinol-phosphate aminotransferase OS=Ureibacillus acetophenoni OX=614649 GN=hisC PE=3 SV=1 [Ureibacillus acetophenoni]